MKESPPALIVMCKAPVAGAVKTRLAPLLSAHHAVDFAVCLARDTVAKAQSVCPNVIVAFSPSDGRDLLAQILPENQLWTAQEGSSLGERMNNVFISIFNKNFSPLVMIGTDSPTLPPDYIKRAFAVLSEKRADVVLGAAEDGGYYLIGLNQPTPEIFKGIEWSSPRTFEQTAGKINKLDLRLEILPAWYDVDLPADIWRLRAEIATNEDAARIAPHTADWLRQNASLF